MNEQAAVQAKSPKGYPISITVQSETTSELLKRVGIIIAHLEEQGYTPPDTAPSRSATEPETVTKENSAPKPGDDYTILVEVKNRLVRIFNPYKPEKEEILKLGRAFGDVLGTSIKAELIKKNQTSWGKAHWTIPIGYYNDLIEHPFFAAYSVFRDEA